MTIIYVGSTSEIKGDATKLARLNTKIDAELIEEPAASGISNQPYGPAETSLGAKNRAKAVKRPGAWALGIESGACRDGAGWVDIAAIALIEPGGREWLVWSDALRIPDGIVEAALARGTEVTWGDILSERTGCASYDPHASVTNQERSRTDFLADAIEKIFRFVGLDRFTDKETP